MDSYAAPWLGRRLLTHAVGAVALLLLSAAQAAPVPLYTPAEFNSFVVASLPGAVKQTLDFDAIAAGTIVPNGSAIDGISFSYNLGDVQLAVADTYETTSGNNSLGTTDLDVFQAGDGFSLAFAQPVNAVGMFFISADPVLPRYIALTANGFTAELASATPLYTLSDGGQVFFLGLGDGTSTFSSATVSTGTTGCVGCFLYNVDDIVTAAVPEPSTLWLLGAGLVGLGLLRRRSGNTLK